MIYAAVLQGTVNDPNPFPPMSRAEGSHHWAFERLLSAALIPMTGAAFVTSGSHYPLLDGILAVSLVVHSHIGVSLSVGNFNLPSSADGVTRSLCLFVVLVVPLLFCCGL